MLTGFKKVRYYGFAEAGFVHYNEQKKIHLALKEDNISLI